MNNPIETYQVTGSIVLFHSDESEIRHVISCFFSSTLNTKLYLIDNSSSDRLKILGDMSNVEYVFLNKNVGYGAAHNVAIKKSLSASKYHVILNPDISFDSSVLKNCFEIMERDLEIGLLSPMISYPDGRRQEMCRLLPNPFDLIARRFLPSFIKPFFRKRLDNYIMKGLNYNEIHNIPNLPGSFMFIRNSALDETGGFDENFFMYLEDIDLTRRIQEKYKTLYWPEIRIIHSLEQGSYKKLKLLKYHIESAIYYFNKWGWLKDPVREEINSNLLKELNEK